MVDQRTTIDLLLRGATAAHLEAVEAELHRLLPLWPSDQGEPCVIYGPGGAFLGLGKPAAIGEVAPVLVPAGSADA
jgi:hypothetical protein